MRMSDTATVPDVVTRGSAESALKAAVRPERSNTVLAGRAALWTVLMIVSAITLIPIVRFAAVNLETWTLLQADNASIQRQLIRVGKVSAPPDYLEALAELGVQPATQDIEAAYIAARDAVKADPSRAHAWGLLAYLETQRAGKVTPASLEALTRSMNACPLCDQDLIRWRFNFVLANWNAIPDETRRRAFEQADILRWIGQNREFLAEMRMKAAGAGIPFDDYRSAVATPVRNWDIAPVPEASAAAQLRPKT
jgi:hypothetical protein